MVFDEILLFLRLDEAILWNYKSQVIERKFLNSVKLKIILTVGLIYC